jgi:hypothetical protein
MVRKFETHLDSGRNILGKREPGRTEWRWDIIVEINLR